MVLSPRFLNEYFKKIEKVESLVDYNTCVDKIIQISPCYDLSARTEKVKGRDFGYMGEQVREYNGYAGFLMDNDVKVEMEQIYNINDFKYDGSNIWQQPGNLICITKLFDTKSTIWIKLNKFFLL